MFERKFELLPELLPILWTKNWEVLHYNSSVSNNQLIITDISGRRIYQSNGFENIKTIDARQWTPGAYILYIAGNSKLLFKKLIKP